MIEFGTHKLVYLPPQGAIEAKVAVSISSEANLDQMLQFFEDYLKAAGYCLGDRTLMLKGDNPNFYFDDLAGEFPMAGGDSLPYDPYNLFGTDEVVFLSKGAE
jgi:hypothetical protein